MSGSFDLAIIPTHNPAALIAYYLGVACFIPLVGFVLAVPAIVCGIVGIWKAIKEPKARGLGHALAGIICGVAGPLLWIVLSGFVVGPSWGLYSG
jgi:hypothetical protein